MKKILITGHSGMLGWQLYKTLNKKNDVYSLSSSTSRKKKNLKFDLKKSNYKIIKNLVDPNVIIHCAAETNIDKCEIDKKNCKKINFDSVKKLINLFPNSKFIFISSDSVYSGKKPHKENHLKLPLNNYGHLKLKAENLIRKNLKNYFIIRTTPVGLPGINKKKTFVSWIIEGAHKEKNLNLFEDVFFSPISINYLAKEIEFIISKNMIGTFNISSSDSISKYHFAKKLCKNLNLKSENIKRSRISEAKLNAKRNNSQVLDCSLYQKKFERKLPSVSLTINDISNTYLSS